MFEIGVNGLQTAVLCKTLKKGLPHFYQGRTALWYPVESSKKLLPRGLSIGHHLDEIFGVLRLSVAFSRLLHQTRVGVESVSQGFEKPAFKIGAERVVGLKNLTSNPKPNGFSRFANETLTT